MQVLLIGKEKIYKLNLPDEIRGVHWITDENRKNIIKIEENNGIWQVVSNEDIKIINPKFIKVKESINIIEDENNEVERASIKEYGMYVLRLVVSGEAYVLYCLPEEINELHTVEVLNTNELTIGSNSSSSIIYKNIFISDFHGKIIKKSGSWYIQNYNGYYGIFVNGSQIGNRIQKLSNGDLIFIMGLKIIILNDMLFINNPQKSVVLSKRVFKLIPTEKMEWNIDDFVDDSDIELKKEDNYFLRAPRIINSIEKEKLKIDAPPAMQDPNPKPLALTLGPSMAFGLISVFSLYSAITGMIREKRSFAENLTSLAFPLVSFVSMIFFPVINYKYDKKVKIKYEEKRQVKYREYLNKKQDTINELKEKQRDILLGNYISAEQCEDIVFKELHRLWERKYGDNDFLDVRLGTGMVPLQLDISYPDEAFVVDDDDGLRDEFNNIFKGLNQIDEAPVHTSLFKNKITSFIFEDYNEEKMHNYINQIILQLIVSHSYEDLNIVFLVDDLKKWDYVRMLPHVWNISKDIRFLADKKEDMLELSEYFEMVIKNRNIEGSIEEDGPKDNIPYYLIITDNYGKIANLKFIKDFLAINSNISIGLICITDDFYKLPNECKKFVRVSDENIVFFENENSIQNQKKITMDEYRDGEDFENVVHKLANIPIIVEKKGSESLPNSCTFLEMYGVGNIDDLTIYDRWKNSDTSKTLKALLGVDSKLDPIYLDIHEKAHGPHGLIAGSTGSGKSEFIMTYILSLAINYHPNDVSFLLIDYKGGGLAGAFEKQGMKLPHVIGTITNIDTNGLQRSLDSVQSEVKKRQILFNEVRNIVDEGTIDIYKYQKYYHQGVLKDPVPHLIIVCDEFAELKQQQPEFMEELISISRIGRSLGVHLILATQKPAGVVNDQIRSNSKFAVCLKVQDTHDSSDVIKKPDAAFLRNPGQFYLQVGNDEYFVLGQSGWAGAPYVPAKKVKKKIDTSLEFISNIGYTTKKIDNFVSKTGQVGIGEQLTSIVKYICDIAKNENLPDRKLWLEKIPENIYVDKLREKYKKNISADKMEIIIGEYDDPSTQSQGLVTIDYKRRENILIFGNAESGKETFLSTFIYDSYTKFSSEVIQFYLIDLGSEALKIFKDVSHMGDIAFANDVEKIDRLFELLQDELKERKQILSDYNGDFDAYLEEGNKLPIINVIINNYETFMENYPNKYDDTISSITRDGPKYGILFMFTVSTSGEIRYRLKQNFSNTFVLQQNKEEEYSSIFNKTVKKKLPRIFGRGFCTDSNGKIYEFQTARICMHKDYNNFVKQSIEETNSKNTVKAKKIPVIPDVLLLSDVKEELNGISQVPLGIIKSNFKIFNYDFTKSFATVITGKNVMNAITFVNFIIEEIKELENLDINILDAEDVKKQKDKTLEDLYKNFEKAVNESVEKKNHFAFSVIIGINKFINEGNIPENDIAEFLKKVKSSEKASFILIENESLIKRFAYSEWYRDNVQPDTGIWIGEGVGNQFLFNGNFRVIKDANTCDSTFGFVIESGNVKMLKLIGMKEEKEE